ncbi:MAG: nuclease A inhibitor family protein [Pyrinomonadaceae bacterium]
MNRVQKSEQRVNGKVGFDVSEFAKEVEEVVCDLVYISEIDAPVAFFGLDNDEDSEWVAAAHSGAGIDEEEAFEYLKRRLGEKKEWFDETHEKRAEAFSSLFALLEENLSKLRLLRRGEAYLDNFVVGISETGQLLGVTFKSLET